MTRSTFILLLLAASAMAQSPTTPAKGKYPPLNVQVTVGTQQRAEKGSWYKKTMTISPKMTVDGTSRMVPIPEAEAIMLVITMDTKAKYTAGEENYKVLTTETIPIPAAQTGDRRSFTFGESTVTFDSYRDSTNAGGAVYKYYVFALRDPASKEILDFKTNNPPLQTFIKARPEKRADYLAYAKGARFPAVYK